MMRDGQYSAAMASVQGLRSTYDWVERLRIIGECQMELGHADLAEKAFRAALALYGADAYAHGGLGMALKAQGRLYEAIVSLMTAVDYSRVAGWPVGLAETLIEAGRVEEAHALVQRSIQIWPDYPGLIRLQERLAEGVRFKARS
jgi:tetratricopeptide (TPR) repeat protein